MKKEILRQLRSNYEEIEIRPSRELWDRIDHALEERSDLPLKKPNQWWKYAAVVVLLISFGGYLYFDSKPTETNAVIAKSEKPDKAPSAKKQNEEVLNLEVGNEQHKNVVISDQGKMDRVKSEKSVIKSHQEDFKANNPILAKAEEEKKIQTEDGVNISTSGKKVHDQIIEKPVIIAEKKKASYINADDLLLGREIDKTRQENHGGQKKIGVLDMEKIKIKGPNSLKVLGMTVFSDSSSTK